MTTWDEVVDLALELPRAARGEASVDVGRHPFVRLREVEGRKALQLWCRDDADVAAYRADPETYLRVDVFSVKASVWAWLDRLEPDLVRELVEESWLTRTGRRDLP